MATTQDTVVTFSVGDRVRERAHQKEAFGRALLPQNKRPNEVYYYNNARVGQIVQIVHKRNKRGGRIEYLDILWDGQKTPSLHMRNRVSRIETR